MMNGQQPREQIDLRQEVAITLPLGTWNTIVACIAKQPWEIADPLIGEIKTQVQAHLRATEQQPATNGGQRPEA